MKYLSVIVVLVIALFAIGSFVSIRAIHERAPGAISDFASCMDAGFPVRESFPRTCTGPQGTAYTEDVAPPAAHVSNENIDVVYPLPGAIVSNPIPFSGEAKGSWYFEGSFPVEVRTASGTVVATVPAKAKGDWMTDNFVPFEGTITISKAALAKNSSGSFLLVFKKDNPSGDPARNAEVAVPITVK